MLRLNVVVGRLVDARDEILRRGSRRRHCQHVPVCYAAVSSPGFVARRDKDWNYVIGHSRWTTGPGAAVVRWL